ncbi:MAG: tRNA pseudouridine(38-40) synthase TruA [Bacteroidales bacterium]|nr:tRNA pseudouridine(38-40) synthase TruA [Bacteroidales bacterium]
MRYFIHLAYNGAPYFGWQIQPAHISVQEVLEKCLSLMLHQERIPITGCGRTDTGVHASSYYAHFDVDMEFTEEKCQQLTDQLNNFLPKDIVIYKIFAVKPEAHARFDAQIRTYQYFIATRKNPFNYTQRHFSFRQLDVEKMNEASALLLKNEDFTSFSKVHTQVNNFICHVTEAHWTQQGDDLVFTITANRFLRNMVRAIVGTLLDVGLHKISIDDFQNIINQKDRCEAGTSAPAGALFLTDVRYNWNEIILQYDEK